MSFNFKDSLKKFADAAIGTEVTRDFEKAVSGTRTAGDAGKTETRKGFQDYKSFPIYDVPEPNQWAGMQGEEKRFTIEGNIIEVNANLDTCMKYYSLFIECAKYYTERFKFRFANCATDFDSFLHYFENMYTEGLTPMIQRAYSLFLPLGIYDMEYGEIHKAHSEKYHVAIDVYDTIAGIQRKKNQDALSVAGAVTDYNRVDRVSSSSISGLSSARMKADLHNAGYMLTSLALASYMYRVTPAQKIEIWEKFDSTALFQGVYSDYSNTFFTLLHILSKRRLFDKISTDVRKETMTIYNNLKNPMFPEEQFLPTITKIIATNPFVPEFYDLLESKIGQTDEVKAIRNYFIK